MTSQALTPFWRRVARYAGLRLFHWAENNGISNVERNGEAWLIRRLIREHLAGGGREPLVVVDGGANIGDYSAIWIRCADAAGCPLEIHAFEPSPAARERLVARFEGDRRIRVVGAALGAQPGEAWLHDGLSGDSQASIVKRSGCVIEPARSIRVPVITLQGYLDGVGLDRVDMLKLDVEGYELAALTGAGSLLSPRHIRIVQFEYGGTTLDAGESLQRYYLKLTGAGYRVAKLLPAGFIVRDYGAWMDNFSYANYLALSPEGLK